MSAGRMGSDPPEGGRLRSRKGVRSRAAGVSAAWAAAALLLVVVPAGVVLAARSQEEPFPHEEHAGLFPVCTGCHAGIPEGDSATAFPEPEDCAQCHDGADFERVEWTRPAPRATNLTFTHVHHAEEMAEEGEEPLQCESCHSADLDEERMAVERGRVPECMSCHAPEYESHYAAGAGAAECTACHVALAESGFDLARLEALPEPESHEDSAFLGRIHGETAGAEATRCATCHVQDRCASCHVDAGRDEVAAVPPAPPGMELPAYAAEYTTPESHRAADWLEGHEEAASVESCATCHTQDDCAACHAAPAPTPVRALPRRADVQAPGVVLTRRAPESHFDPAFVHRHGTLGELRSSACAACHTETFCSTCHDGGQTAEAWPGTDPVGGEGLTMEPAPSQRLTLAPEARPTYRHGAPPTADTAPRPLPADTVRPAALGSADPGFHPPNYAVRHEADAWGRTLECASCHSTEVFCRSCHVESGVGSRGRAGPGYHDAIPLWLFRHGTAARQGLESCASCHTEVQCLRCHSTVGAFRVSPHGPDFDPERARDRSARTCFLCHLTDPLQGPEP